MIARMGLGAVWVGVAMLAVWSSASMLFTPVTCILVAIGAGLLTLVLLGMALSWRSDFASVERAPLWTLLGRWGIHLLPLYLFAVIGVEDRSKGPVGVIRPVAVAPARESTGFTPDPSAMTWSGTAPKRDSASRAAAPLAALLPGGIYALTVSELYTPDAFPSSATTVQVIGSLSPSASVRSDSSPIPDDIPLVLVRFLMTCCAADAYPIAALLRDARSLDGEPLTAFSGWVRVTGRWLRATPDSPFAIIEVELIESIPAPDNVYLTAP